MNSDGTPKADQTAPEAQPTEGVAHTDELAALRAFFETHGNSILTALAVAIVLVAGSGIVRSRLRTGQQRASADFGSARGVQDLEALAARQKRGPLAPLVKLRLAKAYYDAGSYDLAMQAYADFAARYAGHEMLPVAELGRAHCLEARGDAAGALEAFKAFAAARSKHYLRPASIFGQARCLRQLGKSDQARQVLEEFIAVDPAGKWTPAAEELTRLLAQPDPVVPTTAELLSMATNAPVFSLPDSPPLAIPAFTNAPVAPVATNAPTAATNAAAPTAP